MSEEAARERESAIRKFVHFCLFERLKQKYKKEDETIATILKKNARKVGTAIFDDPGFNKLRQRASGEMIFTPSLLLDSCDEFVLVEEKEACIMQIDVFVDKVLNDEPKFLFGAEEKVMLLNYSLSRSTLPHLLSTFMFLRLFSPNSLCGSTQKANIFINTFISLTGLLSAPGEDIPEFLRDEDLIFGSRK